MAALTNNPMQETNWLEEAKKSLDFTPPAQQPSSFHPEYYNSAIAGMMADPGAVNSMQMKVLPAAMSGMSKPLVDEDTAGFLSINTPGIAGQVAKGAYDVRNNTMAQMGKLIEETNKAAALPSTIAKTWQEAQTNAAQGMKHEADAMETRFKMSPDYAKLQGAIELYKKYGEQMGLHQADEVYAKSLEGIPLHPKFQQMTGMRSMRDVYRVFGSKNADVYSSFVGALGRIEAAGITAGGMVAAAREANNLNNILANRRQLLDSEEKMLRQNLQTQQYTDKTMYQNAVDRIKGIQDERKALDVTMKSFQNYMTTRVGVEDKGTGTPAPAGGRPTTQGATSGVSDGVTPVGPNKKVLSKGTQWRINASGQLEVKTK